MRGAIPLSSTRPAYSQNIPGTLKVSVDKSQRTVFFLSSLWKKAHILAEKCVTRLRICNPSTSAKIACLSMGPRRDRMSLVILSDETLKVSHQLGPRILAIIRWWKSPSADKVTCMLPRSSCAGFRYGPRESVDHRVSPSATLLIAGVPGPAQPPGLKGI